jgi:uncharacterized protein (DUF1697 family)
VRFVVLLRGVNAGPRNRIKMGPLKAALEKAGFLHVRTLLQSGNVIVDHDGSAAQAQSAVGQVLVSGFGLDVAVLVRDEAAWRGLVADNPLGDVATDGSKHFVVFCSEPHDPAVLPAAVAPEQLVARPRELHVWSPGACGTAC